MLALVLVFLSAYWIQADADARVRQYTVENWNASDGETALTYFSTNGVRSDTLVIVLSRMEGNADMTDCDALIAKIRHSPWDKDLRRMGFVRLQVGVSTKSL